MSKILLTPDEQYTLDFLQDLNKPRGDGLLVGLQQRLAPHQIDCLSPLYKDNKKLLFLPLSRKVGKSECAAYILWRHAVLNPGSICLYIAPEKNHGREIMWDGKRLQEFMGKDTYKYIGVKKGVPDIHNGEMKIWLKNGSLIQVTGSDNWAKANGLTPSIAVYDEFKVFNSKWHTEFDPNRSAKAAPLVIIGTFPKPGDGNEEQYWGLYNYAKNNPTKAAIRIYTTFDNPINQLPDRKEAIEQQIEILRSRGEEDVVQREYYSRIVSGGSRAIFPMINKTHHVRQHEVAMTQVSRDLSKLEWFVVSDPGTTTCFGALLGAINPYNKKVYLLGEIYEKDQKRTSVGRIVPRIMKMMSEINPKAMRDDWVRIYDEAAAWFATEAYDQFQLYFSPTNKKAADKEKGLSLIKDMLNKDLLIISDKCPNLFKEMRDYAKDDKGRIPKKNDHLIDCLRYILDHFNYTISEEKEIKYKRHPEEDMTKFRRMRELERKERSESDWTEVFDYDWDF